MEWMANTGVYGLREAFDKVERMQRLDRRRERRRTKQLGALDDRVAELEDELGRMSLLVCALLRLGMEKSAFSPEELQLQLDAIDLLDGEPDGKLSAPATPDETEAARSDAPAPRSRRSVRERRRD